MNKMWLGIGVVALTSVLLAVLTLIGSVAHLFNLYPSSKILPTESVTIVFYLSIISIFSAWGTRFVLKRLVDASHPLSLSNVKSYIYMAKECGLLTSKKRILFDAYTSEKQNIMNTLKELDGSTEEGRLQQQTLDELQCELELLLNELHRLLIASWFDSVSPEDPDFPRATRQALARASVELQIRIATIKPNEAARIVLTHATAHFRNCQSHYHEKTKRLTPLEDGRAETILALISDVLVSTLLPPEISSPPGGELLSSLLAHGALRRALALVSNPGWLALQVAQAVTGEDLQPTPVEPEPSAVTQAPEADDSIVQDLSANDMDMDSVQEACTPADDTPDLLAWPSDLGSGPKLWGTCSLQPEQPTLPQIVEPSGAVTFQPMRKASEAEWLNPSPPRQHLGLQLSKSSQDLSQVTSRDPGLNDDIRSIKFSTLPSSNSKESSLGSYMREETSLFGSRVRVASSDVLGNLRARASALLSPARDSPQLPPPSPPQLPLEPEDEEDSVSPVYEEASDLASTIAKLRTLLQHREQKSSTEEEELVVENLESQVSDEVAVPQTSSYHALVESAPAIFTCDTESEMDNSQCEWMEAEEAPELPEDGRPFMNISIPATELSYDSSGQQFVQYCIQYDAVYVQEGDDGPRLVLQTTSVKRRFQEFLNLQNRLEENPVFRSALRAVKGPSRWLSLAFSKAGQQTTAARLPVLERFLQQLCEQPVLARSPALRNFLAYGSNRALAFTKQGSDLPRLDKMLARTVSGVFHSIKTALPSFDFELSPASSVQQLHSSSLSDDDAMAGRTSSLPRFLGLVGRAQPKSNQLVFMDKLLQSRDVARDVQKYLMTRVEHAREAFSEDSSSSRKVSLAFPAMVFTENTSENLPADKIKEDSSCEEVPCNLTSLVEELLTVMLPGCWLLAGPLPQALRTYVQKWTEDRLQALAEEMWSLNSAVFCLRLCRAALAPGVTVKQTSKEEGRQIFKRLLSKSTPGWLQFVIGGSGVHKLQLLLTDALCEENTNQELALNLALAASYLLITARSNNQVSPISLFSL